MRPLLIPLVALLAPIVGTALASPPAAAGGLPAQVAGTGVSIQLVNPGGPGADPRAAVYITDAALPDTTLLRVVAVTNTASAPETVSLYAAGASISGGLFRFADGHTQDDLSSWTTVTPTSVTLAGGAGSRAAVEVAVPPGTAPGERYAVVWAEVSSTASGGIEEVNRVGVRMYVEAGGGTAPSDFSIGPLVPARLAGHATDLVAQVHNTGARALDVGGQLRLLGAAGQAARGPFPVAGATIGIGQSAPVTVTVVSAVPKGAWQAELSLASGLVSHETTTPLTFPIGGAGTKPSRSASIFLVSVGFVAALAIAGIGTVRRRRRPAASGSATGGPPQPPPSEEGGP